MGFKRRSLAGLTPVERFRLRLAELAERIRRLLAELVRAPEAPRDGGQYMKAG